MLDVIGVGFGRTGTLSLKNALEMLGFGPCHHMLGLFEHPDEIALWKSAGQGEPVDWAKAYAGYRSTVDWPGARFWRELVAEYPEAKVILTVRDPQRWYESARDSIYASMLPPDPGTDPIFTQLRDMSELVVWQGVFEGRFEDVEHAIGVFTDHIEAVCREVPEDRLLVFEVADGWQPLCEFLDVPVPDEEFPRLNNRTEFTELIDERSGSTIR